MRTTNREKGTIKGANSEQNETGELIKSEKWVKYNQSREKQKQNGNKKKKKMRVRMKERKKYTQISMKERNQESKYRVSKMNARKI